LGYTAAWKVLEEMVTDFKKRRVTVPANIMNDLKSARTVIDISKTERHHTGTTDEIEKYLKNVESYLVLEGQNKFGVRYADEWLKRIDDAGKRPAIEKEEKSPAPSFSRQQKWIRITPSAELPLERLRAYAQNLNLCCRVQADGRLLVSGDEKTIKRFVKKVATKHKPKTENSVEKVRNC
jgi:hypothetical protein